MKQDNNKQLFQHRDRNRLSLLNKVSHYSNSKEKTKNSLALYTITNEINKIKSISKKNNLSFQNHQKDKIPINLTNINPIPTNNIFNNIPMPDSIKGKSALPQQTKNMLLSNSMKAISNNANRTIEETINIVPSCNTNILTNKRASSHSPHKLYEEYATLKTSASTIDKVNIKKLKRDYDKAKAELTKKESQINSQANTIVKLEKEKEMQETKINSIKMRYGKIKEQLNSITVENKYLKEEIANSKIEVKFLQEKELKLMQVIYLIKERGINIDEVLADVSQMNQSINETDRSLMTTTTVYFPDKVNMNDLAQSHQGKIPILDFGNIPSYRSDSSTEKEASEATILPQKVNMKFNKINFTSNGLMDSSSFSNKKLGGWSEGTKKK